LRSGLRDRSLVTFILLLVAFTVLVTVFSEGTGVGMISTSFVKTLGKTLCLCLVALAMDLVWGYCGILSLGHFAFSVSVAISLACGLCMHERRTSS